jgi:hypothetical protein
VFRSAAALLEELHRQSPEGRRYKLRTYANIGLLCIDEVGYLSFDDKAADSLYEVVHQPALQGMERGLPQRHLYRNVARSIATSRRHQGH